MLSVEDAYREIVTRARPRPPRRVELSQAHDLVLAEDIVADLDSPPFDKALVDGYAVRSADLAGSGEVELRVVEQVVAGVVPRRAIGPGEATSIMTGAPLPEGADAVVMVERTRRLDEHRIGLSGPVPPGSNRLLQGREMHRGEVVLRRGHRINGPAIGLLATVGRTAVLAVPRAVAVVVATGDELVPAHQSPGPGQIRDGNSEMLAALARACGANTRPVGSIASDEPLALRRRLEQALEATDEFPESTDVLIVSGGVSAGIRDLVPAALEALGFAPVFHNVRVKPGKPLWFGISPTRDGLTPVLAFGLPGNPVSGLVGMRLFVAPALRALRGLTVTDRPETLPARLAKEFRHGGDRPTYHPCRLLTAWDGPPRVEPLSWAGSPDLRTVASADGFAVFPAGDRTYEPGDPVQFLPLNE
jgi:molybdopterin molybdotransferase